MWPAARSELAMYAMPSPGNRAQCRSYSLRGGGWTSAILMPGRRACASPESRGAREMEPDAGEPGAEEKLLRACLGVVEDRAPVHELVVEVTQRRLDPVPARERGDERRRHRARSQAAARAGSVEVVEEPEREHDVERARDARASRKSPSSSSTPAYGVEAPAGERQHLRRDIDARRTPPRRRRGPPPRHGPARTPRRGRPEPRAARTTETASSRPRSGPRRRRADGSRRARTAGQTRARACRSSVWSKSSRAVPRTSRKGTSRKRAAASRSRGRMRCRRVFLRDVPPRLAHSLSVARRRRKDDAQRLARELVRVEVQNGERRCGG